jgi:endonuclease/exonuclease/phosphatase family metal-dependent hydrolase
MKLLIILIFMINIFAKDFSVATFNVQNLFDLRKDGTEYDEYIPNRANWNKRTFGIKLRNIAKVIKDMDKDIVALQEIENRYVLKLLLKKLPKKYKYFAFVKNKLSAIGVGIISKYPIISHQSIHIRNSSSRSRHILECDILVSGKRFKIFINHWSSKKQKESSRIPYALALMNRIKELDQNTDYIIVGDLNSDYDESKQLRFDRRLNDTQGISAINQVLNTTLEHNFIQKDNITQIDKIVHYNLWLELNPENRFSHKFRGQNGTLDNIIIPKSLFDNKGISYIDGSFGVFRPKYLYNRGKISRWQRRKSGHIGKGYSDHLPIYASFTTKKIYKNSIKKTNLSKTNIDYLYRLDNLSQDIRLKKVIVLYRYKDSAILKQKNSKKAIFAYKCAKYLQVGRVYDIVVSQIYDFYGLKEIKKIAKISLRGYNKHYNKLKINGKKIDKISYKHLYNMITNISGVYKKGKLHYKGGVIKIYFKTKKLIPRNGSKIQIHNGYIATFKSKIQINIYQKSDFSID